MSTVALALVKELAVLVKAPRMLYLHWPFGHALGEPDHRDQQRTVLHDALSLARTAPRPGLIVELPYRWKREVYPPISDLTANCGAFATALARAIESQGGVRGSRQRTRE